MTQLQWLYPGGKLACFPPNSGQGTEKAPNTEGGRKIKEKKDKTHVCI
jgi:hypothetical protein